MPGRDMDVAYPPMSSRKRHRLAAYVFLASSLLIGLSNASAQQAKVIADGVEDFEAYCVPCHGPKGRGDGEMASILAVPPSDLTLIAEEAGPFPFWRVYSIIAGDVEVAGHDTFQMPQFIERLKADTGKPGYLPAHIRILLLTHYLESLQPR